MKPTHICYYSGICLIILFLLSGCLDNSSSSSDGDDTSADQPPTISPPIEIEPGTTDCNGDVDGTAYLDSCGFCVGGNSGGTICFIDCNDVAGGTAVIDNCGDCVGGTTGQVACATTPTYPTNAEIISSRCTNNTYYLDQLNGLDTNNGDQATPWKTLSQAQAVASSGDCVIIETGAYAAYQETVNAGRTDYTAYIAKENSTVTFKSISIKNSSYLTFYGIAIEPGLVDPASSGELGADDPLYPESTQGTYAKSPSPVRLDTTQYIEIIDCKLTGPNKYLSLSGVTALNSQNVLINHCEIKRAVRGINISSTSDITISYNIIYEITASAINQGNVNCPNTLIIGNHAWDSNYAFTDDYCPRALDANYHGSAIALRSGNTTIQNNIFHNGWSSSGIMAYDADIGGVPQFDNITIENNLLYDITNVYILRIYLMGDNFIVRNNTFISKQRIPNNDGRYEYSTAFLIHSIAPDGAPHISIHNNVFIGKFNIGSGINNSTEDNNFSWSHSYGFDFYCDGDPAIGANDRVLTCSYFDNPTDLVPPLFIDANITMAPNHNLLFSFRPDLNSELVNFGDSVNQPVQSLGSLDHQGFILNNGALRSNTEHSAGAYEIY